MVWALGSQHERELLNWVQHQHHQPSCAAPRRVFSLIEQPFPDSQARAMDDCLHGGIAHA